MPFRLSEDWALITRTKLPAIVQPPKKLGDHWAAGLSNGYTTFFLSPEHGEGFYWGVSASSSRTRRARYRQQHDRHLHDRQRRRDLHLAGRRHDAVPQREEHQLGGRLSRA